MENDIFTYVVLHDFATINKEEYNFFKKWGIMNSYIEDDISLDIDFQQIALIDNTVNCLEELT